MNARRMSFLKNPSLLAGTAVLNTPLESVGNIKIIYSGKFKFWNYRIERKKKNKKLQTRTFINQDDKDVIRI